MMRLMPATLMLSLTHAAPRNCPVLIYDLFVAGIMLCKVGMLARAVTRTGFGGGSYGGGADV